MNKQFLKALAELAFLVYVTGFLGLVSAAGFDLLDLASWKAAAVSAIPPVLVIVYGAFARLVGNFNSPLSVDTREGAPFSRDLH